MNTNELSVYEKRRQHLAAYLDLCPEVKRHDTDKEKEAWALAHALLDIDESVKKYTNELLPKLERGDASLGEIVDVLHAIGEEFRHMLASVYYDVELQNSDPPRGIPVRLHLDGDNRSQGADLNPAIYKKLPSDKVKS